MMETIEEIEYHGYTIEVLPMSTDDVDNPWGDDESGPVVALHDNAERRFGWTTAVDWQHQLTTALAEIADRGVTKKLYGPGGALDIVNRWARVAQGAKVILPISAIDHSGVAVYLGSGAHVMDPGGWDSGWIGWVILDGAHAAEWGTDDVAELEARVRSSFEEFAAWVEGDVCGYRILTPDGEELDSCWGYFDATKCFAEHTGWVRQECEAQIDAHIQQRSKV